MRIWDACTGQALEEHTLKPDGHFSYAYLESLAFSPDGTAIVSALSKSFEDPNFDTWIEIWIFSTSIGLTEKRKLVVFPYTDNHDRDITFITLSPDGTHVAASSVAGSLWIWNTWTGKGKLLRPDGEAITSVAVSADGRPGTEPKSSRPCIRLTGHELLLVPGTVM